MLDSQAMVRIRRQAANRGEGAPGPRGGRHDRRARLDERISAMMRGLLDGSGLLGRIAALTFAVASGVLPSVPAATAPALPPPPPAAASATGPATESAPASVVLPSVPAADAPALPLTPASVVLPSVLAADAPALPHPLTPASVTVPATESAPEATSGPQPASGGEPATAALTLTTTALTNLSVTPSTIVAGVTYATTLSVPEDPHTRFDGLGPGWVKFLIFTADPTTVYFQDSNLYPFHYDFAIAELPQFSGMTPQAFDNATLFAAGQQAMLGAVLIPPRALGLHVTPEYGIQLVRYDAYTATQARDILQSVAAAITAPPNYQPFYMPTFEQFDVAQTNATFFATEGFPIGGPERWDAGNSCYSHGWAVGTLKSFPANQIDAAFLAGQLLPGDILLTDGVPAEIPLVAGVITSAPSTPNSHVALLAQTFNVPFTFLAKARDLQKAQELIGHRIALRVRDRYGVCEVRLVDTDGQLDAPTVESLLALKAPPPLAIEAIQPLGAYSIATDGLAPTDIRYVGGKAANVGILRQAIPANSPVSTAFSFQSWTEFLDQTLANSNTLRQEIAQTLSAFSYPPTDMQALDTALGTVRDLIEDEAQTLFSTTTQTAVVATLQDPQYAFNPNLKIRFRSSTNVEDSAQFTGAGLYESKSGCLADDLDGNATGPSICDATEADERGVFRAIRRVFSSFYNLNAYLERLRHSVDEDDVGMAMLVHHSFPDANELANGVGTFVYGPGSNRTLDLVLQPGANSVTNPNPGQIPEETNVYISTFSSMLYPTVNRNSNLLPLGDTVLDFPGEYEALGQLLWDSANRYQTVTGLTEFTLDFEFKKLAPSNQLIVTQVRPIPQADSQPTLTPFLLNEPTEYCQFQGESGGTLFSNHRLKSRWQIETANTWLTPAVTAAGFYADVSMDFVEGCGRFTQAGPLNGWPGFTHGFASGQATESWTFGDLQNPRTYRLFTDPIPTAVSEADTPLMLLTDFGIPIDYSDNGCLSMEVTYASPVVEMQELVFTQTSSDYGMLCPCRPDEPTDVIKTETATAGGIGIDTRYRWPKPLDVAAGYTAPLIRFEETTITGITTQPIVLSDGYAQTYKPGHHNFTNEYLFQPALDPSVPATTLAELELQAMPLIYGFFDFGGFTAVQVPDSQWNYHCLDCRGPDADGDGRCAFEPTFDCDDANGSVWALPGEVPELEFSDSLTLRWNSPSNLGGDSILYDVIRSSDPENFAAGTCVATNRPAVFFLIANIPLPGEVDSFLVRGTNFCPGGDGTSGIDSGQNERIVTTCP